MTTTQISRALVYLLSAFERAKNACVRTRAMVWNAMKKLTAIIDASAPAGMNDGATGFYGFDHISATPLGYKAIVIMTKHGGSHLLEYATAHECELAITKLGAWGGYHEVVRLYA